MVHLLACATPFHANPIASGKKVRASVKLACCKRTFEIESQLVFFHVPQSGSPVQVSRPDSGTLNGRTDGEVGRTRTTPRRRGRGRRRRHVTRDRSHFAVRKTPPRRKTPPPVLQIVKTLHNNNAPKRTARDQQPHEENSPLRHFCLSKKSCGEGWTRRRTVKFL